MLAPTFAICYARSPGSVLLSFQLERWYYDLWGPKCKLSPWRLLCFCRSSTSIVKVGALWGIIYWPGSLDTAGSNLKTPFLRKLDLRCPCRVPYLDSWHITNTQTKHWLYSSNGAASFNPCILEDTSSGNIHPQPGPLLLTCYQHWQMQISIFQAT